MQKRLRFLRNRPGDLLGAAGWGQGGGEEDERKASPGSGKANKAQDKGCWGILARWDQGGIARQRGSGGGHGSVLALLHQQLLALPSH